MVRYVKTIVSSVTLLNTVITALWYHSCRYFHDMILHASI